MSKFIKNYFFPLSMGIILSGILVLWGEYERSHVRNLAFDDMNKNAKSICDVIVGSLQSDVTGGHISKNRFRLVLENIRHSTGLNLIKIDLGNTPLVTLPEESTVKIDYSTEKGMKITENDFYYWRTEEIQNCRGCNMSGGGGGGRRRGSSGHNNTNPEYNTNLTDTKQKIVIAFPRADYDKRMRASEQRIFTIQIAGFIAVLALMISWIVHLKSQNLKTDLESLKIHNIQLEELNLVAAGLAHETKNPLGIIRGMAQNISEKPDDIEKTAVMAQKIIDQSDITSERLGQFLNYAKNRIPKMQKINLSESVNEIGNLLESDFRENNIEFKNEINDLYISADKEMLYQVLTNLFLNSIAAMPDTGKLTVKGIINKGFLTLIITDSGKGIAPDLINDIFKPYISGNKNGHGIGLSVVRKIIDACKWGININSQPEKGTHVCISGIKIET